VAEAECPTVPTVPVTDAATVSDGRRVSDNDGVNVVNGSTWYGILPAVPRLLVDECATASGNVSVGSSSGPPPSFPGLKKRPLEERCCARPARKTPKAVSAAPATRPATTEPPAIAAVCEEELGMCEIDGKVERKR
jgi:hypothetical protein